MIASRPSFEVMQKAYPKGTAAEVKKLIGGKVDAAWITNTCVIRLSRALNYSGAQHKIRRTPTMNTITGSDKLWYGFRVREFVPYFTRRYGKPEVVLEDGSFEQDIARGKVAGPSQLGRGVIAFEISGWSNATGHVDLWNWSFCLSETCLMRNYFKKASKVHFWRLP
ncbi:T6SS effector amidase Tae4 family protein [Candidatus Thiosymbion oneisti]|uniref:T6SS effector amidase Tae4 family protein n=1 Tax=Candidatus Thiosymbion oneisti TaxID=589554 RepID=UPI000B7E11D9|nr:T6SS effector amidase Tae4 family protein [Candidatus Thiosymbion oneisti]